MKIKLLVLCTALLISALAICYSQMMTPGTEQISADKPAISQHPFPSIVFQTPDGKILHINDIREPTILVHFWAAWCPPCRIEFPQLLKYIEASHGKIALLAVSLDNDYETSRAFLDKFDTGAPHLYWAWDKDKKISLGTFDTIKVPETIIVGPDRMMTGKIVGPGPWDQKL